MNKKAQLSMEFIITVLFVFGVFAFSLLIFQERTLINHTYSKQWEAKEIANRLARNINNTFLMDDNSVLVDYFFWDEYKTEFTKNSVLVYYSETNFVDAPILALFEDNVSGLNGEIFFKKTGSKVIITNE